MFRIIALSALLMLGCVPQPDRVPTAIQSMDQTTSAAGSPAR